jgi:hypothetical protein
MTHAEFDLHMNRLASVYSKGAYPTERVTLIYDAVKNLDGSTWGRVVDQLISECSSAPMLPKIRELVASERERAWSQHKTAQLIDIRAHYRCSYCRDNGVYVCTRKGHDGVWAFRCHCDRGLRDPRATIPYFTQVHAAEYTWVEVGNRGGVV